MDEQGSKFKFFFFNSPIKHLKPLAPRSDKYVTSPYNIHT